MIQLRIFPFRLIVLFVLLIIDNVGSGIEYKPALGSDFPCHLETPVPTDIETDEGVPITSKEDYVAATLYIEGQALRTRIRGRGNSTWGMPKKPYRLKLDKAAELVGMPAEKDWALLANYSDKTMLRNALAFCLSNVMELEYTPRSRYVDLTLNGSFQGLYQLTEHIETGTNRVNIGEETDASNGFLIEWDARYQEEPLWFLSSMNIPFVVKSEATAEQVADMKKFINLVENALKNDYVTLESEVEIDSLVKFYLINELMKNNDGFALSTYLYKPHNGLLRFGPVWDFDIAAGNINYNNNDLPIGFWIRNTPYMKFAFEHQTFREQVRTQWQKIYEKMSEIISFIDDAAVVLDQSQERNFEVWDILDTYVWPNAIVTGSYQGEIDYLKDWLELRAEWLDEVLINDNPLSTDLAIQQMAQPPLVSPGGVLTYHLTVSNLGDQTAQSLELWDTYPVNTGFLSYEGEGWTCNEAPGRVYCYRDELAAGMSSDIQIQVLAPKEEATCQVPGDCMAVC